MKTEQVEKLLMQVGEDFEEVIIDQGKAFVREATLYSLKKERLAPANLPYVFFTLLGGSELWPDMPEKDTKALKLAGEIVARVGLAPDTSSVLKVPALQVEAQIDRIVQHMGEWSSRVLFVEAFRGWFDILKRYTPQVPRLTEGEVPAGKEMAWLARVFRSTLSMRQGWHRYSSLLLHVLTLFPSI